MISFGGRSLSFVGMGLRLWALVFVCGCWSSFVGAGFVGMLVHTVGIVGSGRWWQRLVTGRGWVVVVWVGIVDGGGLMVVVVVEEQIDGLMMLDLGIRYSVPSNSGGIPSR